MKLVVAAIIFLCLGHSNAHYSSPYDIFTEGYKYYYDYYAHALTGIPDADEQYAALAIKSKVTIEAHRNGIVTLQFVHPQIGEINAKLDTIDMEKIPYSFHEAGSAGLLTSPVLMEYDNRHQIKSFQTSANEKMTAINVFRGAMTMLQLDIHPYLEGQAQPSSSSRQFVRKTDQRSYTSEDVLAYEIMEDGIEGECLSQYVAQSVLYPGRPDAQVVNITKTINYDECNHKVEWVLSTHPPKNCTECEYDKIDPFHSAKIINYDIVIEPDKIVVERIESLAQTIFTPMTADADDIRTNHSQVLILKRVEPISDQSGPVLQGTNMKRYEDLRYEFPHLSEIQTPSEAHLQNRPLPFLPVERQYENGKEGSDTNLIQTAKALIAEVAEDIKQNPKTPMTNTPLKAHLASRAVAMLPKDEITQILQQSFDDKIKRQVAIDVCLMAGTLPSHAALLQAIGNKRLSEWEATEVLTELPLQNHRPIPQLIEKVQELCERSQKGAQIYKDCWLAFGSLVSQACGDYEDTVPTIPEIDSYCTDSQESKFLQVIKSRLQNAHDKEERLLFFYVLRIMKSAEITDVIREYVNGHKQVSEMERLAALRAIEDIEDDGKVEAMNIALPILMDRLENTQLRIVALDVVMTNSVHPHVLEKIAALTWDPEESDQLVFAIVTSLESIANSSFPCDKIRAEHARAALAFASDNDDVDAGIMDSWTQIYDHYNDDLNLGSLLSIKTIFNNNSYLPGEISTEWKRSVLGFVHDTLNVHVNLEGVESVINRLVGPKSAFQRNSIRDIFQSDYSSSSPKGLLAQLGGKIRKEDALTVSALINMRNVNYKMLYIDSDKILSAIQSGKITQIIDNLRSGVELDYRRILQMVDIKYQTPSSLGFPIFAEVAAPVILDLKGSVKLEFMETSSKDIPIPGRVALHADVNPTISMAVQTFMGAVNPFGKKMAAAGVASKAYLSAPAKLDVTLNIDQAKLTIKINPLAQQQNNQEVLLVRFKVVPFTTLYEYTSFRQISTDSQKVIMSDKKQKTLEFSVGEELTGIPTKLTVKTDQYWFNQAALWKYWFEDNNPLSFVTNFMLTPEFKYREYKLVTDGSAASKAEFGMTVDIDARPSEIQRKIRQGQDSLKGMAGFWTQWNTLPWQCAFSGEDGEWSIDQSSRGWKKSQRPGHSGGRSQQRSSDYTYGDYDSDYEYGSSRRSKDYDRLQWPSKFQDYGQSGAQSRSSSQWSGSSPDYYDQSRAQSGIRSQWSSKSLDYDQSGAQSGSRWPQWSTQSPDYDQSRAQSGSRSQWSSKSLDYEQSGAQSGSRWPQWSTQSQDYDQDKFSTASPRQSFGQSQDYDQGRAQSLRQSQYPRQSQSQDYYDQNKAKSSWQGQSQDYYDQDEDQSQWSGLSKSSRVRSSNAQQGSRRSKQFESSIDRDYDDQSQIKLSKRQGRTQSSWSTESRSKRDVYKVGFHPSVHVEKVQLTPQAAENVLSVKYDLYVRSQRINRKLTSVLTWTQNRVKMTDHLEVKIDIDNPLGQQSKYQICAKGNMHYPTPPCKGALSSPNLNPIKAQLYISFGQTCSDHSNYVNINAEIKQSREQKESQSDSSWPKDQCVDDVKEGHRFSPACFEYSKKKLELNELVFKIDHRNVPKVVRNVTHKIENFLKYAFYNQMTYDPVGVNNGEGKLVVKVQFHSKHPKMTLRWLKPHENVYLQDINYPEVISQYMRPVNTRISLKDLIMDDFTRGYYPATCDVSTKYLQTFDNETVPLEITDSNCKHVLAMDATGDNLFSVKIWKSVKEPARILQVNLKETEILIKPTDDQVNKGQFDVKIDREPHRISQNEVLLVKIPGDKALAFITVHGEILSLKAPYHGVSVKTSGHFAKVQLSNMWRGDVAGICSDFDGDSTSTLIGPDECEYADVKDFINSFAVPSERCPTPPQPSHRKICSVKSRDGIQRPSYGSGFSSVQHQYQQQKKQQQKQYFPSDH